MKLKNKLYYMFIILFMTAQFYAINGNTNPVVTNVVFSIAGTTVTVTYDVTDAEQSTVTISMEVSNDDGATWDFDYGTASLDIGTGVATGNDKTITWTYSGSYNPNFKIKIIANDLVVDGGPCADATITYGSNTYNTDTNREHNAG